MIFCVENNVDPVKADVRMGAEFLTQYFYQTTVDYSSLNTARSALSTIIEPTHVVTFGNHLLIKRLLKGIFKERPTLPRYTVTYDVNKVFLYMKSLPPVCELNLETITKCLATLLCLLTGQRSQTLAALSLQYMHRDNNICIFYIPKLLKTSRPTFHQQPLELHDPSLCAVTYIEQHITVTQSIRNKENNFFISYVQPYKPVTSTTIARWVTDVLEKSGINITTFRAHSTRSASSSKVSKCSKLSLKEIAKAAGWSNTQTFARYYNKEIINENFGSSLLNNI